MTNKIYSACMTIVILAIIAGSCSKNDINNPQEPPKVQKYHMVINAAKAKDNPANASRRVLGLDGITLNASWAVGEEVTVYNETKNTAISGVLTAQSNGSSTTLSGDLTGSIEPSDVLTLKFLSPNYTGQDGTLEYISTNCDYAEASVTVASVSGNNITTTADAVFENKQAIVKFTLISKADGSTLLNPSTLTINDGTNDIIKLSNIPTATYTENGDGILFVAMPGFADKNIKLSATVGTKTYIYNKNNVTFANGNYYSISTKVTPEGALPYGFSVSPTKRVLFSKGNLQYNTTTDTWRFAENQYDIIGKDNVMNPILKTRPETYQFSHFYWEGDAISNLIDLFAWSSDIAVLSEWGIYPTSYENNSYQNLLTNAAFIDWGANIDDEWYTMSSDEWNYLLSGRQNAENLKAVGTVNGINGCIILPDNWTLPQNMTFNHGIAAIRDSISYQTINNYSLAAWEIMENSGAVFLPTGGDRVSHKIDWFNIRGTYWTSSKYDPTYAATLWITSDLIEPSYSWPYIGRSVRLVQDVE